jgi:hypothetical protein
MNAQTMTNALEAMLSVGLLPSPMVLTGCSGQWNLDSAGGGVKLRLVYAVSPRLSRYSMGLSESREILGHSEPVIPEYPHLAPMRLFFPPSRQTAIGAKGKFKAWR